MIIYKSLIRLKNKRHNFLIILTYSQITYVFDVIFYSDIMIYCKMIIFAGIFKLNF